MNERLVQDVVKAHRDLKALYTEYRAHDGAKHEALNRSDTAGYMKEYTACLEIADRCRITKRLRDEALDALCGASIALSEDEADAMAEGK
jgi:hypothetical protein